MTKSSGLPIGRYYQMEGRQLWLDRAGEGGPTVVMLPAAGMVGLDYLNIHQAISCRTTSVIYDRAGTAGAIR